MEYTKIKIEDDNFSKELRKHKEAKVKITLEIATCESSEHFKFKYH